MPKPSPSTYPAYFKKYVDMVNEDEILPAFANQYSVLNDLAETISEEKSLYAYADGKWTIREVMQHMIDTERVFVFRAMSFARGEKANLPSFEENDYAANSFANDRSWKDLCEEMIQLRKSTEMMYRHFDSSVLDNSGIANNNAVTVRALGFMIAGHVAHHVKIVHERYL